MFNPAQSKLHDLIEAQKAKTGRVRVVILKARQLGFRLTLPRGCITARLIPRDCAQSSSATSGVPARTCSRLSAAFTTTCRKALGRVSERATPRNYLRPARQWLCRECRDG